MKFRTVQQVRNHVKALPRTTITGEENYVYGLRHYDRPLTYVVVINHREARGLDPFNSTRADLIAWANAYFAEGYCP